MKTQFTTILHTDLYQLTMANAYFHAGIANREATFNLYYRRPPRGAKFIVFAGLEQALDWLVNLDTDECAIAFVKKNVPNIHTDFLVALRNIKEHVKLLKIHALDEGIIAYPNTPLVTVTGPQWLGQLIETALLNEINHQSLIATTAAQICSVAENDSVFELGFRRAQGQTAALHGARAAYIGGVAGTSNVLAGKLFNIPVMGTHAHSWIMSFSTEYDAFAAYARVYPDNCVFLVDTYDTLEGTKTAIKVANDLGVCLKGVRLDSGDLLLLSKSVRTLLDDAGFNDTFIIASNDLDARHIRELKQAGAPITVWGVGTRLITAFFDPALGGVYKLASFIEAGQRIDVAKNTPGKMSLSGRVSLTRYFRADGTANYDLVHVLDSEHVVPTGCTARKMLNIVFSGGSQHRAQHIADSRARAIKGYEYFNDVAYDVIFDSYVKGTNKCQF